MPQAIVPPKPDTAPKASGTRAARSRTTRNLEDEIGAALVTVNLPLMAFLPADALDEAEIVALAAAINDQAKRSVRFRKFVERALVVTSGGQLVTVGAAIGLRRAARHGLLRYVGVRDMGAQILDAGLGDQLRTMAKIPPTQPQGAPAAPPLDLDMFRQTFGEAPAVETVEGNGSGEITPEMLRPAPPSGD